MAGIPQAVPTGWRERLGAALGWRAPAIPRLCIATDLSGGMLIYAAGEGEPFRHEVVNLGRILEVVTLDLRVPPSAVLAQVALIADRIRGRVSAQVA